MVLQKLLKEHFEKGFSYSQYLKDVDSMISQNKTSGLVQNELMVNYTVLADRRMRRWNKVLEIDAQTKALISSVKQSHKILIITEAWCGDASHLVPVFCKLTELNPNFETKLVYRDENPALMEQFLTNGAKSIPIIIVMDESYNLVFSWGPRPAEMQQRVTEYKMHPDRAYDDFLNETQVWYNKDKGKSAIVELQKEFSEVV